jgi:UDP-N-acetyl-D-glucosamine dehydrogenase
VPHSLSMNPRQGGQHVALLGQGQVGLILAMRAVEVGHAVVGFDVDDVPERWISPPLQRVELTSDELEAADAVILITDHDGFDYDAVLRHARYVLDTRHRGTGSRVEQL